MRTRKHRYGGLADSAGELSFLFTMQAAQVLQSGQKKDAFHYVKKALLDSLSALTWLESTSCRS